jgi:hypothetical protein
MLAYVFWHWPSRSVAAAEYESIQRAFHSALTTAAPSGFVTSGVFRVDGNAAWLAATPAYANWYLLETSAAIDALNVAAVGGICEQPHTALARAMAAGAGSLFTLRTGDADLAAARMVTFLTKPRPAMSYPEFDALVSATPGSDAASVWRRALVLGPTPEFAVLSRSGLTFAPDLTPLRLALAPL